VTASTGIFLAFDTPQRWPGVFIHARPKSVGAPNYTPAVAHVESDPSARADCVCNVVVQVWTEWATAEGLASTREAVRRVNLQHPGRVAVLLRVIKGCGLPKARAMRGFARFLREVETAVQGVGVVVDGEGFWAASMRALISSVTLVAPGAPPTRVYGDLREASDAIVDLLGGAGEGLVSTDALVAAALALKA